MDYMMSKSAYLTDEGDHNAPHLMFLTTGIDAKDWGSGAAGSPLMGPSIGSSRRRNHRK